MMPGTAICMQKVKKHREQTTYIGCIQATHLWIENWWSLAAIQNPLVLQNGDGGGRRAPTMDHTHRSLTMMLKADTMWKGCTDMCKCVKAALKCPAPTQGV